MCESLALRCSDVPYLKQAAAVTGTILVISAIVFVILGCFQPSWFTHAVGIIGDPHSWQLWTIASAAILISGILLAYSCSSEPNALDTAKNDATDKAPVQKKLTFTHLERSNYYTAAYGIDQYCTIEINKETCEFILAERYSERKDVVVFNEKGEICNQIVDEPTTFAHSCLLELNGENFDTKPLNMILKGYEDANITTPIPRLFIPTRAIPTRGVPHGILLVIEFRTGDRSQTRITLVDSFGSSSGYKPFATRLLGTAKKFFSSELTEENLVCQQHDGTTCGVQMLENIDLLSTAEIGNVQAYVQDKRLPARSLEQIKTIYNDEYRKLAEIGRLNWEIHVTADETQIVIDQLRSKGKIKD